MDGPAARVEALGGSAGAVEPAGSPVVSSRRANDGSWAYRAARATSYVFNPLVFSPVGFTLIHAHFGAPPAALALTFSVSLVFFLFAPLAYMLQMLRRGEVETLELRNRRNRMRPLAASVVFYTVGALVLYATISGPARLVVVGYAAVFPVNTALILLISLRWKMSIHLSSLVSFVSVLLLVAATAWTHVPDGTVLHLTPDLLLPLGLLIPLLAWARVRSGAHTLWEVAGGILFGAAVAPVELWLLFRWALGLA